MTRVLEAPPIDGSWSAPRGRWSGPERRPPRPCVPPPAVDHLSELDRAWPCSLDDFEAWSADPDAPEVRHLLDHHRLELPHRTVMHRRYATRRRSRRPARRNR